MASSPRAKSKKEKTSAKAPRKLPPGLDFDPHSDEFREWFPWTEGEVCDSYTSVEALLFSWFEKEGLDLGRGAVLDLAVRVSACIEPFRSYFRASEGWHGYDLEERRLKAKMAEESL